VFLILWNWDKTKINKYQKWPLAKETVEERVRYINLEVER
jgi:hypothetical protein